MATKLLDSSQDPNTYVPSFIDPCDVISLSAFTMSMLQVIFSDTHLVDFKDLGHGIRLANILPSFFPAINSVSSKPATLNVPGLHMQSLLQKTTPSPYNSLSEGDATACWQDNAGNDRARTKASLDVAVCTTHVQQSSRTVCKVRNFAGDADITGIGGSHPQTACKILCAQLKIVQMLLSTGMLILLVCVTNMASLSRLRRSQGAKPKVNGVRASFLGRRSDGLLRGRWGLHLLDLGFHTHASDPILV